MVESMIVVEGAILEARLLPAVLELIAASGAEYEFEEITVGRTRRDSSHARLRVSAPDEAGLRALLTRAREYGARELPPQTPT